MLNIPDQIIDVFFKTIQEKGKYSVIKKGNQAMITPKEEQEYYKPYIAIPDVEHVGLLLQIYIETINSLNTSYTNQEGYHDITYFLNTLLFNMTSSDANSFAKYIEKRIAFLNDTTFSNHSETKNIASLSPTSDNDNVIFTAKRIAEEPGLETPNVLLFSMQTEGLIFQLPLVRYAFDEDKTCHLFAIQVGQRRTIEHGNPKYQKIVNKINTGLDKYRNTSPGFALSVALFLKMLSDNNTSNILLPDYLFSRYKKYYRAMTTGKSDEILSRTLNNSLLLMQRMEYQIDGFTIDSYPGEESNTDNVDSYTHITIRPNQLASKNKLLSKIFQKPTANTKLL